VRARSRRGARSWRGGQAGRAEVIEPGVYAVEELVSFGQNPGVAEQVTEVVQGLVLRVVIQQLVGDGFLVGAHGQFAE